MLRNRRNPPASGSHTFPSARVVRTPHVSLPIRRGAAVFSGLPTSHSSHCLNSTWRQCCLMGLYTTCRHSHLGRTCLPALPGGLDCLAPHHRTRTLHTRTHARTCRTATRIRFYRACRDRRGRLRVDMDYTTTHHTRAPTRLHYRLPTTTYLRVETS